MSKYYKAEDVINTLADQWRFEQEMEYPDTAEDIEIWEKVARELFADLPTIEVSEDYISREYMLRALNGYGKDWQEDCEIAEIIRNAPSVAPKESEE